MLLLLLLRPPPTTPPPTLPSDCTTPPPPPAQDINLPRPDKYQTAQLVAFLQQLLTHEGYYDENLEFIRVERVQVGGGGGGGAGGRRVLCTACKGGRGEEDAG